jgi:vacuolar-type H+-ATPase subunit I/STV1
MMGLMWVCLGFIVGISVLVAKELHERFEIDWRGWAGLALGEVMVLLCIAWSVAAVAEGEPRAASMGLIVFGAPGVAVLALTTRLFVLTAGRRSGI